MKKEVRPWDRTAYAMKILRVLYFPLYYHKLLERMNLMHYGVNRYLSELTHSVNESYPMIRSYQFEIDSRKDRHLEPKELEGMLQGLRF